MTGYRTVTKPLPKIAPTKTSPNINKKLIKANSNELLAERSNVSTANADIVVKLPINPVPITVRCPKPSCSTSPEHYTKNIQYAFSI